MQCVAFPLAVSPFSSSARIPKTCVLINNSSLLCAAFCVSHSLAVARTSRLLPFLVQDYEEGWSRDLGRFARSSGARELIIIGGADARLRNDEQLGSNAKWLLRVAGEAVSSADVWEAAGVDHLDVTGEPSDEGSLGETLPTIGDAVATGYGADIGAGPSVTDATPSPAEAMPPYNVDDTPTVPSTASQRRTERAFFNVALTGYAHHHFRRSVEEGMPCVALLRYLFEGDNRDDAMAIASVVAKRFHLLDEAERTKSRWIIPSSWSVLDGPPAAAGTFL